MKVDDARMPTTGAANTSSAKRPSSTSNSFSEVLGRKLEDPEKRKSPQGEQFSVPDEAAFALPAVIPAEPVQAGIVSPPSVDTGTEAANIQALVQEILVVTQPNGQRSVELQFNSKSLDGLQVKISQEQDQIAIRFSASSSSVSDLISRNLDQLSDALHRKGLQVAPIQVEVVPTPANVESTNTGSKDGRRQEQNEQQRRQQRQKR
jgi:flagellar hook-length control protein FliK